MAALFRSSSMETALATSTLRRSTAIVPERADTAQSVNIFQQGVHKAVLTILNDKATKELVEEAVLSRQAHLRNGETIKLVEDADVDVIDLQFHSMISVQSLLAELSRRGVDAAVRITWRKDAVSQA